MKTALLHYWLTGMRGGEMVLAELCKLFPDADIYTHAAIPDKLIPAVTSHPITETLIAKLPFGRKHCQLFLPLMPYALKRLNFSEYDLIISSESGPIKGIIKPEHARHICYCHTPMRYLWDMYDLYYQSTGACGKLAMAAFKNYLRSYDLRSADSVDDFIANSKFVAERINRIYHREAAVIYPPVDVDFFSQASLRERTHYLFVGQLVCYKRPDLVVKTFARLPQEKLIVVGNGPLKKSLQKNATANVSFLPCNDREKIRDLYASSKALIFPGIEDFGIVPVEAQAAGCPVIAMNAGGTKETVLNGETGILMNEQTVTALLHAIEDAGHICWDSRKIKKHANRFSTTIFCRKINAFIQQR